MLELPNLPSPLNLDINQLSEAVGFPHLKAAASGTAHFSPSQQTEIAI